MFRRRESGSGKDRIIEHNPRRAEQVSEERLDRSAEARVGRGSGGAVLVQSNRQREHHTVHGRLGVRQALAEEIPEARLTGHQEMRLPNHASFAFKNMDGNLLLTLLDAAGFACSSGSACKTGNPEPSEVMAAIGLPPEWGLGSLRVTLGKDSTAAQVESFLDVLPGLVEKVRTLNQR